MVTPKTFRRLVLAVAVMVGLLIAPTPAAADTAADTLATLDTLAI